MLIDLWQLGVDILLRKKLDNLDDCAVSKEEYEKALDIRLAYAYQTSDKDTLAEQWKCDSDCYRNNGVFDFCPGEFQICYDNSKKLCKYFLETTNE